MADTSLLPSLKETLAEKTAEVERLSNTFQSDEKGRFTIPTEQFKDYRAAVAEAAEVKSMIDDVNAADKLIAYRDGTDQVPAAAADLTATDARMEAKSLGDMFIDSDAYKAAAERGFGDGRPSFAASFEGKSLYNFAAGHTSLPTLGTSQDVGIAEIQRRKMHIRDLFPKSSTNAHVLYGIREVGWTNNAEQIRQRTDATGLLSGNAKWGSSPESFLELTSVLYPVAEISHHINAHKNILADEKRLRTFIDTRLVDGVKYAEDRDLLYSVGDGEKITGLFNTPGIQEYTGLATDKHSIQVRRAITKAALAEYEPNGLIVSPTMWEQIEVEEDDHGAFRVAVAVAVGAEKRVWRLNVVETTAMSDVNFVVGNFGLAAQLHDRESVKVEASSEHGSNFVDGVITLKGAERVAFEIPRPEAFVVGSWTTPA